jgi:hypothetical protein
MTRMNSAAARINSILIIIITGTEIVSRLLTFYPADLVFSDSWEKAIRLVPNKSTDRNQKPMGKETNYGTTKTQV